ncbi:hypothetical protein B7P43_G06538 [Cryptotermes secundus]|uniref:Uncharacterized protein n=1 Tax=Cryptotermes secundus TaxID=105785 RepID=A0A2J7RHG2_9NEOP|nr:hypothetical protein B7P43_G06538 [Cryptotermes secundus]
MCSVCVIYKYFIIGLIRKIYYQLVDGYDSLRSQQCQGREPLLDSELRRPFLINICR